MWNMVVLLLLLYTASFVPIRTAFIEDGSTNYTDQIVKLEYFVDSMYIMDFFLNFFMAYEDDDKKIETRL